MYTKNNFDEHRIILLVKPLV